MKFKKCDSVTYGPFPEMNKNIHNSADIPPQLLLIR